jgi:uncharacterized protein YeaO (DUF488 family)
MIKTRRVYEQGDPGEKYRILVDKFWPRGISKEKADWNEWMREIAPSDEIRKWYHHDFSKWDEFRQLYGKELEGKKESLDKLLKLEKEYGTITFLYSSREKEHNNATALMEFLSKK